MYFHLDHTRITKFFYLSSLLLVFLSWTECPALIIVVINHTKYRFLSTEFIKLEVLNMLCWCFNLVGKRRKGDLSKLSSRNGANIDIGPGNLKMSFSSTSGQLNRMYNSKTGVSNLIVHSTSQKNVNQFLLT